MLVGVVIDFSVEHCVVGETFEGGSCGNVRGHVVYVKKEEEGAKNSTLWDSENSQSNARHFVKFLCYLQVGL